MNDNKTGGVWKTYNNGYSFRKRIQRLIKLRVWFGYENYLRSGMIIPLKKIQKNMLSNFNWITKGNTNANEFLPSIQNYDALIVRSDTKITADILESGAKNLKAVGRAGVGVDNIDVDAATKHNIIVLK